ncbi:MAG: WbqC family protein [Rikenellaceae bacterium]|nr:WbqC family protein [Rikenellaceae bacterium]
MLILSTAYLGNIRYYTQLIRTDTPVRIDLGEHYRKQSFRNRCEILGANGIIPLTIPVHKSSGEKTPVSQVRIDHSKSWRRQHWNSIWSAYKNSPFFDHYAEHFEPLYATRYELLWEWNRDLQQVMLHLLGAAPPVEYSSVYLQATPADRDWRDALSGKPRLYRPDPDFHPAPYYQVFTERIPFVPNLSIVDLLFCEGPAAGQVLRQSAG